MQYKWTALSVTTVGTLNAGIDTRIVIVGLPTVARALGADVESIVWGQPAGCLTVDRLHGRLKVAQA